MFLRESVCLFLVWFGLVWFWFCKFGCRLFLDHHNDVIMGAMASQITSFTIVYSTVYSGADQRKYQSSASLAFVTGESCSARKGPVTRKMFPFDDVIMIQAAGGSIDNYSTLVQVIDWRRIQQMLCYCQTNSMKQKLMRRQHSIS